MRWLRSANSDRACAGSPPICRCTVRVSVFFPWRRVFVLPLNTLRLISLFVCEIDDFPIADSRICLFAYLRICLFAHSPMRLAGLRAKDGSPLGGRIKRSLLRSFHQPDIQKQPRVHTLGYLKVAPTEL